MNAPDPTESIERQSILGTEAFVERMVKLSSRQPTSREVPRRARAVPSLTAIERKAADRDGAIRAAYATGGYTLAEIGDHFGLHYSTVSRIAGAERRDARNKT